MTKKTSLLFLSSVLAVALFLPPGAFAASEKVLKVGACQPFSGPPATWGRLMTDGPKAVIEDFNAKGGLEIAGNRYRIELIEADTKCTPEGAINAARRLVEVEKVHWIVGALFGHTTLAMQEVTEQAKIITLNTGGVSDVILKERGKSKYSFRSWIAYNEQVPGTLKWIAKAHPNSKRIALLDPNVDSCWEGQKIVKKFAPKNGQKIVYSEFYPPPTSDFYPFLTKLMANKPDVFFTTSAMPQAWALLVKGARELGFKGIFVGLQPPDIAHMIPICGKDLVEGIYAMSYAFSGDVLSETTKKWIADFEKNYGSPYTGIISAPTTSVVLQAYEEAGSLNSDKVLAVLESGKTWDTIIGIKGKFGAEKRYGHPHQWLSRQFILEVKNGKNVPIYEVPMDDLIAE